MVICQTETTSRATVTDFLPHYFTCHDGSIALIRVKPDPLLKQRKIKTITYKETAFNKGRMRQLVKEKNKCFQERETMRSNVFILVAEELFTFSKKQQYYYKLKFNREGGFLFYLYVQ